MPSVEKIPGVDAETEAWRANTGTKTCSCLRVLTKTEYAKHLKDGTHNDKLNGKPSEVVKV